MLYDSNYILSSANSINIGRLIPQVVYYFYGYLNLLKNRRIEKNEFINIVVPTGNFGNILAAYYAKEMGLPINKLICASNENNVLYDFLSSGIYDKRRELKLTSSPSMDILISSNLERLLYEISERDDEFIKYLMANLQDEGKYEITESMRNNLEGFTGGYATTAETKEAIHNIYKDYGYVIDTHTAVAASVYDKYLKETGDTAKTVIVSTASPYKFAESVLDAIGAENLPADDYEQAKLLQDKSGTGIPAAVEEIHLAEILHHRVCGINEMQNVVEDVLKII
jgi:threonine synthase